LRAVLASQIFPDDPKEAQSEFVSMSPDPEQRQKVLEMIQALKFVQKHGPLPEA